MERTELDVLIEQLDELLGAGVQEPDQALELATIAGLAYRLGAPDDVLEEAEVWRDDADDLLDTAFEEVQLDELIETLNNLELSDETEVDEAVSDFDDLVAAAAWVGRADSLRPASALVAAIVRRVPDPFACLASDAELMLKTDIVAGDLALYDYWAAILAAGDWA